MVRIYPYIIEMASLYINVAYEINSGQNNTERNRGSWMLRYRRTSRHVTWHGVLEVEYLEVGSTRRCDSRRHDHRDHGTVVKYDAPARSHAAC